MNVKHHIVSQFSHPQGYLGQLAGVIMANRSSNVGRNSWTLDLLELEPTDRVLEIGFGPGIAINMASQIVTEGVIVGIDHSETMLYQAKKRNKQAIAQGKLTLYLGSVEVLPSLAGRFDKIYTSNVVQFWDNPERNFAYFYDALLPGGCIATTYMPRHSGASTEDALKMAREIEEAQAAVGFKNIRTKQKSFRPVSAVCILANK